MIQVELPLAKPISDSQKRQISFLMRTRRWTKEFAIKYFERYNQGVADRRTARQFRKKVA